MALPANYEAGDAHEEKMTVVMEELRRTVGTDTWGRNGLLSLSHRIVSALARNEPADPHRQKLTQAIREIADDLDRGARRHMQAGDAAELAVKRLRELIA